MSSVALKDVVAYCDQRLAIAEQADYGGAVNGLQVDHARGQVTRIVAAVDASPRIIERAIASRAQLLLVHHGLFWGPTHPWTGDRFQRMRAMFDADLAVYSAHLPLDRHPEIGNNALLGKAMGLEGARPFFATKYGEIGLRFEGVDRLRGDIETALAQSVGGRVTSAMFGPERVERLGIVTGGAGAELSVAAAEGVDTFITGEGPHWSYALAQELKLNVLYGGHYATETFGVKALVAELAGRFSLDWEFLDDPSGL